jgi:tRNA pseudouridine38-40 synthase
MRRICIVLEYDGTNYGGWQRQNNAPSIQEELEKNLLKITGEKISVQGSGRTDSGVHALGQVAHFDTSARMPADKFALALNAGLPRDIRVRSSREVSSEFHARFCAKRKRYRYTINNGEIASALQRNFQLHYHARLEEAAMEKAARMLEGTHDFRSFMATGTRMENTVRTIYDSSLQRQGDLLIYEVEGNGFLYNMVRIIVGTLLEIGMGKYPPEHMEKVISACDRAAAGPTAPAQGLMLVQVEYPEQ